MKTSIFKISIIPVLVISILGFTTLQPGNGKGQKGNKEQKQSHDNSGNKDQKSNHGEKDHGNDHDQVKNNNHPADKSMNADKKNEKEKQEHGKSADNGNNGHGKNNKHETIHWTSDNNINWSFDDFPNRKHPKDMKKVSICHNTGASPVNINVSENAVQAHLNHGDQLGSCGFNYGNWPKNYIQSRENVYNSYENTWENLSYSEALLKIALGKLLGLKTDLDQNRSRLSAQEIQRRELLIMDLQNNTSSLDNQIGATRQSLNGINININL